MEKSLEEILGELCPTVIHDHDHPGDRDDNLWVTLDGYRPPQTQLEWEQTCFLDQPFHGYYCWPRRIKYSINKRERYTPDNMPEEVAILYDRFSDRNFLQQVIELMLLDEVEDEDLNFSEIRFAMFKVNKNIDYRYPLFSRVSFVILVWLFWTISWNNSTYSFERREKKNK